MAQRPASNALIALTISFTLLQGIARAENDPVVERLQHGEVNWTDKTVQATGSGAPNMKLPTVAAIRLAAERAAELAAYKNILEALKGVRVSAQTLGGTQLGNPQVRAQVEGIVRGCKKVDTRYFSDYGVDVVMKCPLDGPLASVLSPQAEFKPTDLKGEKTISGLIVDATGIVMKPTLAPRVVSDDGSEVYSQSVVKPTLLEKHGAVAYYSSVELAKKSTRVGDQPLIVKASSFAEESGEIKIASADAQKIKAANLWFLTEGRVVVATESH